MFKKLEEELNRLRDIKDIKKKKIQIKLPEIRTMLDMKSKLDATNSRLDTAEEKISKRDDIAIGTMQNEKQRKSEQSISKLWNNFKQPNICATGICKGEESGGEIKNI